jgi:hypothetical protein
MNLTGGYSYPKEKGQSAMQTTVILRGPETVIYHIGQSEPCHIEQNSLAWSQ